MHFYKKLKSFRAVSFLLLASLFAPAVLSAETTVPQEVLNLQKTAETALINENYSLSIQAYQEIISKYPDTEYAMEAQKDLVLSNLQKGDTAAAEAEFQKLQSGYTTLPGYYPAMGEVGRAYLEGVNPERARQIFANLLSNNPDAKETIWIESDLIRSEVRCGQADLAANKIDAYLQKYSEQKRFANLGMKMIREFRNQDRMDTTLQLCDEILQKHPDHAKTVEAVREKVRAHLIRAEESKAEEGLAFLRTRCSANPAYRENLRQVSRFYRHFRKYHKANSILEEVLAVRDDPTAKMYYATNQLIVDTLTQDSSVLAQKIDKHIERYRDVEGIDGEIFYLGEAFFQCATDFYRDNPTGTDGLQGILADPNSLRMEAPARTQKDYFRLAVEMWKRLLEKFPQSPSAANAVYFTGVAYRHIHEYENAIESFQALINQWPEHENASMAHSMIAVCRKKIRVD